MTLNELGKQYALSEQKIRDRIVVLREQCKGKPAEEKKNLERRIWVLINDAADCRRVSMHLIHYYDERGGTI